MKRTRLGGLALYLCIPASINTQLSSNEIVMRLTADERELVSRVLQSGAAGALQGEYAIWGSVDLLQYFLDRFQNMLDSWTRRRDEHMETTIRRASRLLIKISRHTEMLPSSLFLRDIKLHDSSAVSGGGFSDIFRASYYGRLVALKRVRVFTSDVQYKTMISYIIREALLWRQLVHDHVLPFLGVDIVTFGGVPCMVAPWMPHGNALQYMAARSPGLRLIKHLASVREVIDGLRYLHGQSVIHGDLRAANILIDEQQRARLSDFGLSRIVNVTGPQNTTTPWGAIRWAAPEQLLPETTTDGGDLSFATDIYSLGCVVLELHTLKVPFYYIRNEAAVVAEILRGRHPNRPPGEDCTTKIPDETWCFMEQCWDPDPNKRFIVELTTRSLPSCITLTSSCGEIRRWSSPDSLIDFLGLVDALAGFMHVSNISDGKPYYDGAA